MTRSRGSLVAMLAVPLVAVACSGPAGDRAAPTGTVSSAIIHGTDSTDADDAVVLVMHYDAIKIGGDTAGCTGTLLTPRLVLTARHCVADTDENALCDSQGNATVGGGVRADNLASKLYAFVGRERPDFISGLDKARRGAEIIDDGSMTLCNHDIALILLEKPLVGGKTVPIRLDDGPRKDEAVSVVGWGVTDKAPLPQVRQRRTGVKVVEVGPADRLGPAEFILGESGCSGDSGGPAFAESGAVLGVLSRGGNASGAQAGTAAACIDAENVFTKAASYKDLIVSAYEKAGQEPWLEGQPDPTTLPPMPPKPDDDSSGCAAAPASRDGSRPGGALSLALATLALAACVRRRRSRC